MPDPECPYCHGSGTYDDLSDPYNIQEVVCNYYLCTTAKPTIAELEAILYNEEKVPIEVLPNGEVRAKVPRTTVPKVTLPALTAWQRLMGEEE